MSDTTTDAPADTALTELLARAAKLQASREVLGIFVGQLKKAIEALEADRLPEIRAAIDSASSAWLSLREQIAAHPELFVRPRTMRAHGIKFGFEKGKGGLVIADEDRTVELIHKHFSDQAEVLIAKKETPVKDALAQLPAADLKRVGVEVKGTGDVVVIRPADADLDKLVKALVSEAVKEGQEGGA